MRARIAQILALLALAGCPAPLATPVVIKGEDKYVEVPLLFGTDRKPTGLEEAKYFFSGERGSALRFGRAVVSIPRTHKPGVLETPPWWRIWNREAVDEFILLGEIDLLSEDGFVKTSKDLLAKADANEILLFVHGYANTFEDAARRAAQIAYDIRFPGVTALYSWPSEGDVTKYTVDEANVSATTGHLQKFLSVLRERTGATRLHLVAHSMGSRALLETIALFSKESASSKGAAIQHLVFAAPDVDAQRFLNLISLARGAAPNVTLYASSNDRALKASSGIHGSQIAGQTVPQPIVTEGVFTIDASDADTDFLGHSYVGQSAIIDDMFYLLRNVNDDPSTRARMSTVLIQSGARYWKYK